MPSLVPTEYEEQVAFVQWLELQGYYFTAIPNSTYTKSWNQKRRNTAMGLRPGFPDMVIIARGRFMCVEMKRVKGGVTSVEQKMWILALRAVGIPVKVCRGCDEAIAFVEHTLTDKAI